MGLLSSGQRQVRGKKKHHPEGGTDLIGKQPTVVQLEGVPGAGSLRNVAKHAGVPEATSERLVQP